MDFQEVGLYHKSCCWWSFQREDTLLVALLGFGVVWVSSLGSTGFGQDDDNKGS